MTKVYLLENGSYSERETIGIFASRKLAEKVIAKYKLKESCIEEYEVNKEMPIEYRWTCTVAISDGRIAGEFYDRANPPKLSKEEYVHNDFGTATGCGHTKGEAYRHALELRSKILAVRASVAEGARHAFNTIG